MAVVLYWNASKNIWKQGEAILIIGKIIPENNNCL
jgi:hypothetical protein